MTEIEFRSFLKSDRAAVLSLFKAAFGKPRDESQWAWEYDDYRSRPIIVVADASGRIVGHYAVLPRALRIDGRAVLAGLVVDVMTHPDYGRRGVFVNSAQKAFSDAEMAGIDMLVGFPNEAAIRGHLKAGWSDLGHVRVYARPLRIKRALGVTRLEGCIPRGLVEFLDAVFCRFSYLTVCASPSRNTLAHISVDDFLAMIPSLDALIEGGIPADRVATVRSADWLAWRLNDPTGIHDIILARRNDTAEISGYMVLKFKELKGLRICAILDLVTADDSSNTIVDLTREAVRTALTRDCDACLVLGNPSAPNRWLLRRMMVLPTPKKLRFIARPLSKSSLPGCCSDLQNWYIEFIDHDVL
jgi:hypothetical protein